MQLLAQPVAGPAAQAPRGGLLAAAQPGATDVRWDAGVIAWPEAIGGWRIVQDCTTDVFEHEFDEDVELPTAARPFVIQTRVTARRTSIEEMGGRARRRLEAVTGKAIARELWTGAATKLDPYELPGPQTYANPTASEGLVLNPHLASADAELYIGALPPVAALGEVEARAAEVVVGGPVYLHVPLAILTELAPSLQPRGDLLYTAAGNLVISDGGYPGTGPDGTPSRVIYGTGPVQVWTGPVDVIDDPSQVVNTRDNRVEVWAERPALALFDPQTLVGCPVEA